MIPLGISKKIEKKLQSGLGYKCILDMHFVESERYFSKFLSTLVVKVNLVIHGLFISKFAHSYLKNWSKKVEFPVKMCLSISKFSIHGPILQDVSTANNESHLNNHIATHILATRNLTKSFQLSGHKLFLERAAKFQS